MGELSLSFLVNPNLSSPFQGHLSFGVYLMSSLKSAYAAACSLESLGFYSSLHLLFYLILGWTLPFSLQEPKFCSPKAAAYNRLLLKIWFHEEKLQHSTSRKEFTITYRSLQSFKTRLPSLPLSCSPFSSGPSCPPSTGPLLSPQRPFPSGLKPLPLQLLGLLLKSLFLYSDFFS